MVTGQVLQGHYNPEMQIPDAKLEPMRNICTAFGTAFVFRISHVFYNKIIAE